MLDSQLIAKAAVFAAKAHAKQVRKYSGDPYIVHLIPTNKMKQTKNTMKITPKEPTLMKMLKSFKDVMYTKIG